MLMRHNAEVNIFLYYVEYEVELGVCVCVWIRTWVGVPEWSKKGKEKFFFLLRCQITGWKALAATKSGFDFMPQRDQTGKFFSTNKF